MEHEEEISGLIARLAIHRRSLQTLLSQKALQGGEAHVKLDVKHGIYEARAEIRRIKAILRGWEQPVENLPDDDDPDDTEVQRLRDSSRLTRLRALIADHSSFINDRLSSFVGRAIELEEIRHLIAGQISEGGFVAITGQAGQGKSSIIARLVAEHDAHFPQQLTRTQPEHIAHHFIPFKPSPDHQISLLRNLIARLLLKHNLPDFYVAGESRPVLYDYFIKVLQAISDAGKQELIFIDGLDQLQEELNGERDLSFLPSNPPKGIVFILGTRPNDTLRPLELLKPYSRYRLPNLKRGDFDLILEHRGVTFTTELADRFYSAMQENALYLDLVAKELRASGTDEPERIVQELADNPDNLFTLAIDRLKRPPQQWSSVIKPILASLMAAREPLSHYALRDLLKSSGEDVRDALERLGGLIARDEHDRYYLFHLKLQEFLRQDLNRPQKRYIFDADEETGCHQKLVNWCESGQGGIDIIWQESKYDVAEQHRRLYARRHYIAHLIAAKNWERLWEVIDRGDYGHGKLRHDPSTRNYALDLDLVRQATISAAEDDYGVGVELIPRLWRYSLLRCSLASQADNCPEELFEALVLLGRAQEAYARAELLTDPIRKARCIANIDVQQGRRKDVARIQEHLLDRAIDIARMAPGDDQRATALLEIAQVQATSKAWESALEIAYMIDQNEQRSRAFSAVAEAAAQVGLKDTANDLWREAQDLVPFIERDYVRAWTLGAIAQAQARAGLWDLAMNTADGIENGFWLGETVGETLAIVLRGQAQTGQCEEAVTVIREQAQIRQYRPYMATVLSEIAQICAQAGEWDKACDYWKEATALAQSLRDVDHRYVWRVLQNIAQTQSEVGCWEMSITTANDIEDIKYRARALKVVVGAMANAGAWEIALKTAESIDDATQQAASICMVVLAQTRAELYDQASIQLRSALGIVQANGIRTVDGIELQGKALTQIVQALVVTKAWDKAIATARAIVQDRQRAYVLEGIARELADAGDRARAYALRYEALDVFTTFIGSDADERQNPMFSFKLQTMISAGDWSNVRRLAKRAIYFPQRRDAICHSIYSQLLNKAKVSIWVKNSVIAARRVLPKKYSWCGSKAFAVRKSWSTAIATARAIQDTGRRNRSLIRIAQVQLSAQAWKAARSTAQMIDDSKQRNALLETIAWSKVNSWGFLDQADIIYMHVTSFALAASAYVSVMEGSIEPSISPVLEMGGDKEKSLDLERVSQAQDKVGSQDKANVTVHQSEGSWNRALVLADLAAAYAQNGSWDQANALWQELSSMAVSYKDASRTALLNILVSSQARAGAWKLACDTAHTIDDRWSVGHAVVTIISAQVAAEAWDDAITSALCIGDIGKQAEALRIIADALLATGQHERALWLIQRAWRHAITRDDLLKLLPVARGLITRHPKLFDAIAEGESWSENFLRI